MGRDKGGMSTKDKIAVLAIVCGIVGSFLAMVIVGQLKQQEENEQLKQHLHARIFVSGPQGNVTVPANIGIDSKYWNDHTYDGYGIGGNGPMHTHQLDNIIHIESNQIRNWTLGEFIDLWGFSVPEGSTVTTDNGKANTFIPIEDYRNHVIVDRETLTIRLPEPFGPVAP